jgi:hypothetical protein
MRKPRWRAARRKAMKVAGITTTYRQRIWIVMLDQWNLLPAWLHSKLFFPRNPDFAAQGATRVIGGEPET